MRGFDYGPRFGSLLICALFMWLLSVLSAVAATVDREAKTRFGFVLLEGQAATFFGVGSSGGRRSLDLNPDGTRFHPEENADARPGRYRVEPIRAKPAVSFDTI